MKTRNATNKPTEYHGNRPCIEPDAMLQINSRLRRGVSPRFRSTCFPYEHQQNTKPIENPKK